MHCHTKEGSPDGKVPAAECAKTLKSLGFGGMMITDHNSYDGYYSLEGVNVGSLVVLKGVEYDTSDFGHILVVMPDEFTSPLTGIRGLSLSALERFVHKNGGILGPAHPCGEPFLSFFTTGVTKRSTIKKHELLPLFDFIEGYNACESDRDNKRARYLAFKYGLPMLGGSDSHKIDSIGCGFTYLPGWIKTNNDLIRYIKRRPAIHVGGRRYGNTLKDRLGIWNKGLVYGFFFYNKFKTLIYTPVRRDVYEYENSKI